ncbi:glycoside hydrolase family 68 protein [Sphingomonas koreensis]|nr:glycoside hydrolase family 68 protein [Sphingomonas koreensis]
MTSYWTREHVAGIDSARLPALPVITASDVAPTIRDVDLWDMWPVQEIDGSTAIIAGGSLWFSLSAPIVGDPIERHALARLRLLHCANGRWRDLGPALPEELTPGSRDWSGSAIVDADHRHVTLFFTAAGRRGEGAVTFEQRLFQIEAVLTETAGSVALGGWADLRESVRSDGQVYHPADQREGAVGTIKAFRDPAFFRDPADGRDWLLFAGSDGRSASRFNGVIGAAVADDASGSGWRLVEPLLSADGLNNELERPHIVIRDGRYYLFWSTQHGVFDPAGPTGPTGLYGMVADRLAGPYRPLNGTGLVLANPPQAPHQAYSWLVLGDLSVVSFVDQWGLGSAPVSPDAARAHFGGVPARVVQLHLDGELAW